MYSKIFLEPHQIHYLCQLGILIFDDPLSAFMESQGVEWPNNEYTHTSFPVSW